MNWKKVNFHHHKAKQYVTVGDPENISRSPRQYSTLRVKVLKRVLDVYMALNR